MEKKLYKVKDNGLSANPRFTLERNKETREVADKIYAVGFKNGQIEMKNKVLKKINRDWTLVTIKRPMELAMKILKMINKLPLSKPHSN